jgi:hypothetical protein
MISAPLIEIIATMDAPTFRDVEQELARAVDDLNRARETLIGAQVMLSQCDPRQIEQERVITCALALIEKAEGLIAVVGGEIALTRARGQEKEEDADANGEPGVSSRP